MFFIQRVGEGFLLVFLTNEQSMLPKLMPATLLYKTLTARATDFRLCSISIVLDIDNTFIISWV